MVAVLREGLRREAHGGRRRHQRARQDLGHHEEFEEVVAGVGHHVVALEAQLAQALRGGHARDGRLFDVEQTQGEGFALEASADLEAVQGNGLREQRVERIGRLRKLLEPRARERMRRHRGSLPWNLNL